MNQVERDRLIKMRDWLASILSVAASMIATLSVFMKTNPDVPKSLFDDIVLLPCVVTGLATGILILLAVHKAFDMKLKK